MLARRRRTCLLAFLALAATAVACSSNRPRLDAAGNPVGQRDKCWVSFAACAPPRRFGDRTDVSKLTTRNLVNLASRLDMPAKLPRAAATRLQGIAMSADQAELLELEAALEDTANLLGKCGCGDEFKSELEKHGIAEIVKERLPSREVRSPEHWAGRIFAEIAAIRELRRRSATRLAETGGTADPEFDQSMRAVQRRLCIGVHDARAALPAQAFATALEIVNRNEVATAGEGSASAARRQIAEVQEADSCPEEPVSSPAAH